MKLLSNSAASFARSYDRSQIP